jgi:glycosyltransferase involved in cell wall biosynthesis
MYDLSVIIPGRNEMFFAKTVENVLANIRGNTEIIAIFDGGWSSPGVVDDPRVTIIYNATPLGQRGATNQGVKLSQAKFIMKLDAHCSVDEGFDVKLMANCEYDEIVIPRQYNLHAFNWKCNKCGNETYQGPTPTSCQNCDNTNDFQRVIVWEPRKSRKTDFWRFDSDLKFQYWGELGHRPESQGVKAETMSCLGACWFLHRQRYWDLDGLDEDHGSWGQMGTELACKSYLSGGKMVTYKDTWFAHMFRTQGGDFGFPYPLSGREVDKARKHSKDTWLNNKWKKAIHPLSWMIEKFSPPGWDLKSTQKVVKKPSKGVLYYTDNRLGEPLFTSVQEQILKGIKAKHITSVSLKPVPFGKNIVINAEPGYLTMARQILAGLEAMTSDIVYFCEHDVLYHPSHFALIPTDPNTFFYNSNIWQIRAEDGFALYIDCQKLSQLVAYRSTLIEHYRRRVTLLEQVSEENPEEFNTYVRKMGFEPGTHNRAERVDDLKADNLKSEFPNLDIRHESNLTPSRWRKDQYRNQKFTAGWTESRVDELPGWEQLPRFK